MRWRSYCIEEHDLLHFWSTFELFPALVLFHTWHLWNHLCLSLLTAFLRHFLCLLPAPARPLSFPELQHSSLCKVLCHSQTASSTLPSLSPNPSAGPVTGLPSWAFPPKLALLQSTGSWRLPRTLCPRCLFSPRTASQKHPDRPEFYLTSWLFKSDQAFFAAAVTDFQARWLISCGLNSQSADSVLGQSRLMLFVWTWSSCSRKDLGPN